MTSLRISLDKQPPVYGPKDILGGSVSGETDRAPRAVEIHLAWFTSGRGSTDIARIAKARHENPSLAFSFPFKFTLPAGPYSFSGGLIALHWVIEAVLLPGELFQRAEFVLSPSGNVIEIGAPLSLPDLSKIPKPLARILSGLIRRARPNAIKPPAA